MLKHLQKSVEEEELVWKSKMAKSEEQLTLVSCNTCWNHYDLDIFSNVSASLTYFWNFSKIPPTFYQALEKASKLEVENQSIAQVGIFPLQLMVS